MPDERRTRGLSVDEDGTQGEGSAAPPGAAGSAESQGPDGAEARAGRVPRVGTVDDGRADESHAEDDGHAEYGRANDGRADDAQGRADGQGDVGRVDDHQGEAARADALHVDAETADGDSGDEMPRVVFTRRRLLVSILFVVSVAAFLYLVLPKLLGLKATWHRIEQGNGWWLVLGVAFEGLSFLGYIALFRAVFVRGKSRIDWRESYEITMSGLAATRLFAAGGAGGIALTAWALRRSGLDARTVACRMIAFMALLYGVYMGTLVIDGLGLYLGIFAGPAPFAITVVPAIFGASVIALFLCVSLLPGDFDRLVARWTQGESRLARIAGRLAAVPAAAASGVRTAIALVGSRDPALLGAIAWWGFDIAVLWACFHAFGASPPTAVIVMAYFVGMIGNMLPLPGGIGGVDGGMIGAFSAFGVPVDTAVVAVLAYRAIAFWLPTIPGAIAYLQLRRTVNRWRTHDAAIQSPSYT